MGHLKKSKPYAPDFPRLTHVMGQTGEKADRLGGLFRLPHSVVRTVAALRLARLLSHLERRDDVLHLDVLEVA